MPIQATKDDVVLSGHGAVDVGTGETAIPGGFELVVLAPPGASISDRLGGLIERGVGFETMDTAAACRTYNVLVSEGRNVVAALLFEVS
jgi:hypothetical protein